MPKIKFNEANRKYYSEDFIKGFECGTERQYKADQKTGHWIAVENEEMEVVGYYCSECDLPMETEQQTKFCPNCGAKMVKPQEREVKRC